MGLKSHDTIKLIWEHLFVICVMYGYTEKRKGFMFMEMINNKFTLEDLYIGMEIKDKDQLSDIYDTWIMLVKNSDSDVYTVGFIGKETNTESDKLFAQGNMVCPVYNDSIELEGDMYYEELIYPA